MRPFKKICLCGGGSLTHTLAAVLGANPAYEVRVLTRKPAHWNEVITANYRDWGVLKGLVSLVTDQPAAAVEKADLVLITAPSFAYTELWNAIKNVIPPEAVLGAFAGNGGFEFITHSFPGTVFGMQRIPYVCRVTRYGSEVYVGGVREKITIGTRPAAAALQLSVQLSEVLNIQVLPLPNYLNVTLAPANPLFHATRNYSLFAGLPENHVFERPPLFYEEWDDEASSLYLDCDDALQQLCKKAGIDTSGVLSICKHYNIRTAAGLTRSIRKITSLRGIEAPVKKAGNAWLPDYTHRFFAEDMLTNLPVYIYFSDLLNFATPVLKALMDWGYVACSKDPANATISVRNLAQQAGIDSAADLQRFYG